MKKQGVIGFLYNLTGDSVALIKKNKPEWQKGLLNGIGGQVEEDESPKAAMIREFHEEAGLKIWDWQCFCVVKFPDYELYCYRSFGDLSKVKTMTAEVIELHHLSAIHRLETIPNLKWIVPLGADKDSKAEVIWDKQI
jgi:8-oxo-dGTP diphosphatase